MTSAAPREGQAASRHVGKSCKGGSRRRRLAAGRDACEARAVRLPDEWSWVTVDMGRRLAAELQKEVAPGHVLYGRVVRAIARRTGQDDFLFEVPDAAAPLYVVHLTWSRETRPEFPASTPYESLEDFCERWPRDEMELDDDIEGDDEVTR